MSVIDFVEFEFKAGKNNNAPSPLILSMIHTYRNKNEMFLLSVPTNNMNEKNYNKYNNNSDEEEIEKNSLNNQNSISLSDIDINDEGNIYNDTAQEKDNPQNLYIPILEPRAFRENNIDDYRNNTIDKEPFPNDSSDNLPKGKVNTNFHGKYSVLGDKNFNNDKTKDAFFEKNNTSNLLNMNRNFTKNDIQFNKLTGSPTHININNKLININEISNNFYLNNQKGSLEMLNNNNNDQIDFAFLDDCTLDDKESESDIKSNRTSNSFNSQNSKILEQNIEKEPNKINMPCIFKVGDDLRQDSLALQVIQIFREIFKQSGLNIYTYPYQTISTISPKNDDLGGYIEVVKDTDSRDQIGKTYDTNLYDYYLCSFGQENSNEFREARKNLIESIAAYAVISYILQIKDRHNGNILIDKKGHLIHIDFGFIFDISPGGNMKFEKAEFKLTKEMIQIMGGNNSEAYKTFVDLTVKAFLACRDNMNKLLDPVVLMFSSGLDCFRDNSINNFIDRFKLELNEEEAVKYMKDIIQTAEDNWRTNFYDYIQKKQNNIYY